MLDTNVHRAISTMIIRIPFSPLLPLLPLPPCQPTKFENCTPSPRPRLYLTLDQAWPLAKQRGPGLGPQTQPRVLGLPRQLIERSTTTALGVFMELVDPAPPELWTARIAAALCGSLRRPMTDLS